MTESDRIIIWNIRDLCTGIKRPPAGEYDRTGYLQTRLLQIGLSVARLSDEFKDATRNEIKWGFVGALSGITDVLDDQTMREICECDIPVLQNFCERALEKHRENNQRKRSKDDLSR